VLPEGTGGRDHNARFAYDPIDGRLVARVAHQHRRLLRAGWEGAGPLARPVPHGLRFHPISGGDGQEQRGVLAHDCAAQVLDDQAAGEARAAPDDDIEQPPAACQHLVKSTMAVNSLLNLEVSESSLQESSRLH
jgi:hypothetical protein